MESLKLDVLVIGFGKAGKTIAMKRGAAGDRVGIVEQSPQMYGGTCINIGCVPTKKLLTLAAQGKEFSQARQERDGFIAKLNAANKAMAEGKGVVVIDGFATFVGPKTVQVNGELEVTAETIIINTGAVSGIEVGGKVHDSTSIQRLEERPAKLAIVGAGPIGLEFATMFNGFGSQVTVLNGASEFLGRYEQDIAADVREHLSSQGITIEDRRVENYDELDADTVLVAVGRKPAIEGLGLDAVGIEYGERGIVVDEFCQTSVSGVYAAGDVNGGPQFTYISYDDHRVIMDHRWGKAERTTRNRVIPTTMFIQPPLSSVGMTEEEARKVHNVEVRQANIADIPILPRPKIVGQPEGVAKFVVDADTNQILGATLWCIDSQELINTVALAMSQNIPAQAVGDGIYTHPATSEVFNALLA